MSLSNNPEIDRPNAWNLDLWQEGDWSNEGPGVGKPPPKKELFLEPKLLIELRDWSDQQLDLLGRALESLTVFQGD